MKFYVNHCNGIWGNGDGYRIWDMEYVGSLEGRIHGYLHNKQSKIKMAIYMESDIECDPNKICTGILEDDVNINSIKPYYTDTAWNLVMKMLKLKKKKTNWICPMCNLDIKSQQSILCDSCLQWYDNKKFNNFAMPDLVIKNKPKRPVSSVKKQESAPIRPTIKIFTKKKNTYTEEKSYFCTMSQNSLGSYKYNKSPGSNRLPTSSNPRSSQSELKKRFIDRSDNLTKKSYQTLFKELEEQHKDVKNELENSKNMVESLQEQLNKVKHDKEIQTCGISMDQLENNLEHLKINLKQQENKLEQQDINLKNMTDEKRLLNLELGLSLKLRVKNEELLTMATQASTLNSKIEILSNTVDSLKKTDSEKTTRIENLFKERNKYKNDFIEVTRERDLFQEEIIVLKNKYTETNQKLNELKSEVGKKRSEFVQRSMRLSEQSDLNIKQQKQIKLMEDITLEFESMVKRLTLENQDYKITIDRLNDDIVELKNEIKQWETRAGCWINTYVREQFESKIENLENENQRLNVKNLQLTDKYNKTIIEKCEQISEKEKIVEMKQSKIEKMTEIINLMRKSNLLNSDDD
ncbi:hypothetical protein ACI65C_004110 [Semiaphis heraclei]